MEPVTLRDLLTTIVELLGMAAIVCGVAFYDWRAALIVGGLLAGLVGYALSAPPAKDPDR
jgi:hypothetical protein